MVVVVVVVVVDSNTDTTRWLERTSAAYQVRLRLHALSSLFSFVFEVVVDDFVGVLFVR